MTTTSAYQPCPDCHVRAALTDIDAHTAMCGVRDPHTDPSTDTYRSGDVNTDTLSAAMEAWLTEWYPRRVTRSTWGPVPMREDSCDAAVQAHDCPRRGGYFPGTGPECLPATLCVYVASLRHHDGYLTHLYMCPTCYMRLSVGDPSDPDPTRYEDKRKLNHLPFLDSQCSDCGQPFSSTSRHQWALCDPCHKLPLRAERIPPHWRAPFHVYATESDLDACVQALDMLDGLCLVCGLSTSMTAIPDPANWSVVIGSHACGHVIRKYGSTFQLADYSRWRIDGSTWYRVDRTLQTYQAMPTPDTRDASEQCVSCGAPATGLDPSGQQRCTACNFA